MTNKTNDELVVLATFETSPEAHCLRIELEQNGISACVANESTRGSVGASLFGPISAVWIEVLVLKSDAEKALAIKYRMDAEPTDQGIPEWTCACGETVDAGFATCWACSSPFPGLSTENTDP